MARPPSLTDVTDPIVVEVVRNGFVESVHRARVVVTAPDGTVCHRAGGVDAPMYPRSSAKPMQAVAMLRLGHDATGELLALSGASHSGEAFHRDGAVRMLRAVGLGAEALQNTPDLPLDADARTAWVRDGHGPEPVAQNCSGKHAGMLSAAVHSGAGTDDYLRPDHPVQQACFTAIGDLTGETPGDLAVDGCGAPLWSVTLAGLARAFGRIAAATDGPERAVADAFRDHPEWASGTTRDEAALHRAVPGLVCKAGAEGVHAIGLPDGTGIAIKVVDGASRGRAAIAARVLRGLGHDHPTLTEQSTAPVLGHGRPVGEVRVVAPF